MTETSEMFERLYTVDRASHILILFILINIWESIIIHIYIGYDSPIWTLDSLLRNRSLQIIGATLSNKIMCVTKVSR